MTTNYKDYYKILGIERTATPDEINKAYKKLARTYHPDLNPDKKNAEAKFKEINEANDVLKDPEKRKLYDQLGPDYMNSQNFQRPQGFGNMGNMGGFGSSGYSDFFETIFGGGGFAGGQGASFGGSTFGNFREQSRKGSNIQSDLHLTLEEAYTGGKKSISITTGQERRSLEINIPAGVANGARIRLAGQGNAGNNAPAGDLILKINIKPHPKFTLEENNIVYDLYLAPWDAALGCKSIIPTLDGQVELTIASGTSSGKKLRLKGKGLGIGEKAGDLLVRTHITISPCGSPQEAELWEKLKSLVEKG